MEGVVWGPPTFDSGLVTRCHELRRKPVDEFTLDDIRVMVGQGISLPILLPLALQVLEVDPLVETRGCPGGLLAAVLHAAYIGVDQTLLQQIRRVAERAARLLRGEVDLDAQSQDQLLKEVEVFLARRT